MRKLALANPLVAELFCHKLDLLEIVGFLCTFLQHAVSWANSLLALANSLLALANSFVHGQFPYVMIAHGLATYFSMGKFTFA